MSDLSPRFHQFVVKSFQDLTKDPQTNVFVADIDGDALFATYLAAFPEGTNLLFKTKTEHDCSTCKQFIRRAGAVITLVDGKVHTVWDKAADKAPAHYAVVATAMRDAVRSAGVRDLFRVNHNETQFGSELTRSQDPDTQKALTWPHLHTGVIPLHLRSRTPEAVCGTYRTTVQVFERGLVELTPAAVETVVDLVKANSLYRGQEFKPALLEFQKMQTAFLAKSDSEKKLFVWANADSPAARFRNIVIGTLVQDLSEGKSVEHAVQSFEAKVAPTNYKRTTALITPGMVKQAMETINELGLESALERRFAVIGDVSVNDVKWVDGAVKPLMKGGIGDLLMDHAKTSRISSAAKDEERAEDIELDDFMARVLPETQGMEIFLKGGQLGNLMSLTAPVNPEPKQLFRWSNDFAWSYTGNVADSIKERVKKAGGQVTGVLRVSLSWFNYNDLDLHIHEPPGRGVSAVASHIHFRHKTGWTGGKLDVDMNVTPTTRVPVENVIWERSVPDGPYRVVVHNFTQRETNDPGFVIEVENNGKVSHYAYNKGVRAQAEVAVVTLFMKNGIVERVETGDPGITASNISQEKWGLKTEQYVKVTSVMLSPNYWGDSHFGNKHTFFVLDGAKSDEDMRGFYNEFLHPRLEPHRKVFEVIGDKTKCRPTEGQLSGLGFSSTKPDNFLVRVQQGKKQRIFNVQVV